MARATGIYRQELSTLFFFTYIMTTRLYEGGRPGHFDELTDEHPPSLG